MTTHHLVDARNRFPGPDVPVTVPVDPHDLVDLARLRILERDLSRPVVDLLAELAFLRIVRREAELAAAKVEEHERLGYERIRVGAFRRLRDALGMP